MADYLAKNAISYKQAYVGLDRASLIARLENDYPGLRLSQKDDFWSFPLLDMPFRCAFSAIGQEPSRIMILGQERYSGFALHVGSDHIFSNAKATPFEPEPTRKAIQLCRKLEGHGIDNMTGRL